MRLIDYARWYVEPWRLFTLFVGVSIMLFGAEVERAPDWDRGVSLLMCGLTFVLMPAFDRALRKLDLLQAFLIGDFCAHSAYCLYWGYYNPAALEMITANYPASWMLFLLCWAIWCPLVEVFKRTAPKSGGETFL